MTALQKQLVAITKEMAFRVTLLEGIHSDKIISGDVVMEVNDFRTKFYITIYNDQIDFYDSSLHLAQWVDVDNMPNYMAIAKFAAKLERMLED